MEVIHATPKIGKFIRDLETVLAVRVGKTINLLERYGHEVRLPHSRAIGDGLFELRLLGGYQVRIIYTFHNGCAFLLHIFRKKTASISKKDIEYALKIKN